MPLIVLSGYPSSGKTARAQQISSNFKSRIAQAAPNTRESRLRVHIINFESLSLVRSEAYVNARAEKDARATEFSAVKRLLSKDDVIIADGLYYIKGVRYQLYCEARAALTTSCVVHVAAPPESCREWNELRAEEDRYSQDMLNNLIFRFEEPNPMVRWDSPCFVVPHFDESPPMQRIWDDVVVGRGVVIRANQATVLKPAAEGDYLHELGKVTQEIVSLVLDHQRNTGGSGGGSLPVPDCNKALQLPGNELTPSQLQSVRRDFVKLNRAHVLAKSRIRELFIEYFNTRFE